VAYVLFTIKTNAVVGKEGIIQKAATELFISKIKCEEKAKEQRLFQGWQYWEMSHCSILHMTNPL
jgi:hypothetical protein